MSPSEAVLWTQVHFLCTLKADTVRKYAKHKPGKKPKCVGRPCYIDQEEEQLDTGET